MTKKRSLDWKNALLKANCTVKQAIQCLNNSMMQIVLVVGDENKLIGTITDGDIRRGILNGLELSESVTSIVNTDPLIVSQTMTREMILQLMQINHLHQLPVVDDNRSVVGLYLWDELQVNKVEERNNIMIIMAGGKGQRLMPYTENCPKPMLEVGGKPMLEHIIEHAKLDGFKYFVLAIHYLGHMIEDYFGDGSSFGIHITYLKEESPLGTAGALSLMNGKITSPVLITNGDVMTDIHYGEIIDFHTAHNSKATMAVQQYQLEHPFGVVKTQDVDIVGFEEKPVITSYINAGIYVLEPEAMLTLKKNEYCDMPTLFSRLKEQNLRTIVYPMHEPWLDVGRHDDFELAKKNF